MTKLPDRNVVGFEGTVSLRGAATVFVGRSRETEELVGGVEEVLSGSGRVFLICGEPGIGKTRLADEICKVAQARGMRAVWGRCWEAGDSPPYWPWIEVLRECGGPGFQFRQSEPDLPAILRASRDPADSAPDHESVDLSLEDSDLGRFALFEAAMRVLRRAAQAKPLVVVLDDLHDADDASLHFLRFVARGLRGSPILIICTCRDAEIRTTPRLSLIFDEISRHATTIILHGLSQKDVMELARSSGRSGMTEPVAKQLCRKMAGNPFFLTETLRLLSAEEDLRRLTPRAIEKIRIPDSVRLVIRKRISLLPEPVINALRVAALIGVEFDAKLLQLVLAVRYESLIDTLMPAVSADIISEDTETPGVYRFKHSLIAETLREDLLASDRVGLHHKIALAMENLHSEDSDPYLAEIARHYMEAHAKDQSAETTSYLRRAARMAMTSLAYEEAAKLLQSALRTTSGNSPANEELRQGLLMELGQALYASGLVTQARQAFEAAGQIARKLGDGEKLAAATLGRGTIPSDAEIDRPLVAMIEETLGTLTTLDDRTQSKLLARLGSELQWLGDPRAPEVAAQAIQLARGTGDALTLISSLYWADVAAWSVDNLEQRLSNASEAVELAEKCGDKTWALKTHYLSYLNLLENGDTRRADRELVRFSELTDELRLPFGWKELASAQRALMGGRMAEAEEFSLQALEIGRGMERRFRTIRRAFNNFSLILRREQGRIAEMLPIYRVGAARNPSDILISSALAFCHAEMDQRREATHLFEYIASSGPEIIPRNNTWYAAMVLLTEVCVYLGDSARASILYDLLVPYAARNALLDVHVCYGPVARYLAMLATAMSRYDEAQKHFDAAIEMNRRMGARQWLARSLVDYASMLTTRATGDDRMSAVKLLDAAIEDSKIYGLKALGERATKLKELWSEPPATISVGPASADDDSMEWNEFKSEGETWTIRWAGETARLKALKGLQYISQLLKNPGLEIHVLYIAAPAIASEAQAGVDREYVGELPGDAGEMLDSQAKATYRRRLEELRDEIEDAHEFKDEKRAQKAEDERDAIARELSRAVGLGGRNRRAASASERARLSVTRAIKTAIERISIVLPELGRYLSDRIRTGTFCSYLPNPHEPVSWRF